MLQFYRQLAEQDLRAAEQKRIAEQAATGGNGTPAKKVSISGTNGGWNAHEQMLEAADRRQAGATKKSAVERKSAQTKRQIETTKREAIPEMPLGQGARQVQEQGQQHAVKQAVKPQKLGVQKTTLHRPMGAFTAQKGAVVVA